MNDQPPDQDVAPEYASYSTPPPDDHGVGEPREAAPTSPYPRQWAELTPADSVVQDAIALSQLLVAPIGPERALGQALTIGLRLLASARQLAIYAVQPHHESPLLRLVVVERHTSSAAGEVEIEPRPARSLGCGGAADWRVLHERTLAHAPGATCLPLQVPARAGERLLGVLVARWDGAGPMDRDPAGLDLLAPCCATLLERREQIQTQRRIGDSRSLLPTLQRGAPAPCEPLGEATTTLLASAEELTMLREAAAVVGRLLGAPRSVILVPSSEGTLRSYRTMPSWEDIERAGGSVIDSGLSRHLQAAVGAAGATVIEEATPLAGPLVALFGEPTPLARFILLSVRVAGQLAALLVLADPIESAHSTALAMARAELAATGATLHALRLARAAAAEDRARDAFISLAVHELRSPLTAMKGYAQLLMRQARRLALPPAMNQAMEAIEEQATRMADMISEMHDAVRLRRGDLELLLERVELVHLVAHALEQQRKLFPQHEIELEVRGEPLVGDWDPQRVEQIVIALVNNAAHYMPSAGRITVQVTRREASGHPMALVCVLDRGIGVAEPDRRHIFEYLYRSSETKRRHLSGLGLGLFVSRALAELMGGQLWLEQTRTGDSSGSTFCLTLPLSFTV